jgi:hypothetical protein
MRPRSCLARGSLPLCQTSCRLATRDTRCHTTRRANLDSRPNACIRQSWDCLLLRYAAAGYSGGVMLWQIADIAGRLSDLARHSTGKNLVDGTTAETLRMTSDPDLGGCLPLCAPARGRESHLGYCQYRNPRSSLTTNTRTGWATVPEQVRQVFSQNGMACEVAHIKDLLGGRSCWQTQNPQYPGIGERLVGAGAA